VKVKRYVAGSMRAALDLGREELGPDVLILGNRKVDGGVEILVSAEPDAMPQDWQATARPPRVDIVADDAADAAPPPARETRGGTVPRAPYPDPAELWTHNDLIREMQGELHALKEMVEQQLAGFAWGAYGSRHPDRALILRQLVRLGVTPSIARAVLEKVPPGLARKDAWNLALGVLSKRLRTFPESVFDEGGIVVVCGPSGVGKTSTIAKLAARRSLARARDDMTIVSADNRRIGAHQQLKSIGRILGVTVHQADSVTDLADVPDVGRPGHLTLIDTAGCLTDAGHLARDIETLETRLGTQVRPILVLAANMDTPTLEATFDAFEAVAPAAVVITKTDEARTTGAVLSLVAEHDLPVAYVSRGSKIPDDLEPAAGHQLVADLASRRRLTSLDAADLAIACETGFERAVNWS